MSADAITDRRRALAPRPHRPSRRSRCATSAMPTARARRCEDVSLTVPQSRFTALLGLNGAGKTTLFSLITRLYDTRHGSIDVLGHRVSREPGRGTAPAGRGVPGAHARSRPVGHGQPAVSRRAARHRQPRGAATGARRAGGDRPGRPREGRGAQIVGRTDAAGRDRARTAAPAARAGAGRTDRRTGRRVPLRHPAPCALAGARARRRRAVGDPSARRGRSRRCGRRAASRPGAGGRRCGRCRGSGRRRRHAQRLHRADRRRAGERRNERHHRQRADAAASRSASI